MDPIEIIVSEVKEDGSVVIPLDQFTLTGIKVGDKVQVISNGELIMLRLAEAKCDICGQYGRFKLVANKKICTSCERELVAGLTGQKAF
ncbi:hypothetical protein [Bacillus sp. FJAT-29814]|uniref:hypothetical protein n=1 Tax=Bacillus sp. FJAT-29814 TaxID=1729688 RepID=UPI00083563BB|nr:hypothetical protein [Bacillus sp. FJAT-29814]